MTAQFYADQYKRYGTYCRNFLENRLLKVAGGPSRLRYEWMETLMREIPSGQMWGISTHCYTKDRRSKKSATLFGEDEYFYILRMCLDIEDVLDKHITIMDKYDPEKKVALVVDEWGTWHKEEPGTNPGFLYQQNTLRDAMVAALSLNYFNERCERIKMANIAQTINVLQALILTDKEKMLLTPTYHVFEMYKVHHDATLLHASLKTPDYELDGEKLPMISASASKSADGNIHVSIVNIDPNNSNSLTIDVRGSDVSKVSGRILTAEKINSMNTFEDDTRVKPEAFKEITLRKGQIKVDLPAKSIVVIRISLL